MNSGFIIEKGVPAPRQFYFWENMEVGDSVRFENIKKFRAARNSLAQWRKKYPEKLFYTNEKRLRIWRIL